MPSVITCFCLSACEEPLFLQFLRPLAPEKAPACTLSALKSGSQTGFLPASGGNMTISRERGFQIGAPKVLKTVKFCFPSVRYLKEESVSFCCWSSIKISSPLRKNPFSPPLTRPSQARQLRAILHAARAAFVRRLRRFVGSRNQGGLHLDRMGSIKSPGRPNEQAQTHKSMA